MAKPVLYSTGATRSDSSIVNLLVCIGGIYVCYLSYGIFQEKMYDA